MRALEAHRRNSRRVHLGQGPGHLVAEHVIEHRGEPPLPSAAMSRPRVRSVGVRARCRERAWAVCVVAVLAFGACGCEGSNSRRAAPKSVDAAPRGTGVRLSQGAVLALPVGHTSAEYRITAPSPARYDFDVALNLPTAAHVVVQFRTWYGAVLDILDYKPGEQRESSTVNNQAVGCESAGSRLICVQHYPLLPAQKAGAWTVIVSKRSVPAAMVRIAVKFHNP
jgi:hypothetical protein